MVVIGVGTDLVAVGRFSRLIERGGRRFLERWFSPSEVSYCLARSQPARYAAARFAAKEAAVKSLGVPREGPLPWRDIEVTRQPHGAPGLHLHGMVREMAEALGVATFHVSLSHDAHHATATVLAVGAPLPHDLPESVAALRSRSAAG